MGRVPTFFHRVTKYDPAHRDRQGRYTGPQDTLSDHGEVEAAYLRAVAAFAEDSGIDELAVREPQIPSLARFGAEPPVDGFGLAGLFPPARESHAGSPTGDSPGGPPEGFHDGAAVPLDIGLELVRAMLRDSGAWCRLEWEDRFTVHVGWDQYLYVGSDRPCERARARTRRLGLFPERLDSSPYAMETGEDVQRPADDAFWAGLSRMVSARRAGVLEEMYVEGASRWHRLSQGGVEEVRPRLAPRARLAVWPGLSSDVDTVLSTFPADGTAECVWQDEEDGPVRSALVDGDTSTALAGRISGAAAVSLLPVTADERVPLFTAVMPDADGVVRARWRTDPAPADRHWALLRTLRPGRIVSGTVTRIADFGVTFVDIGGFEAMINIPELSWRSFNHPSDVVSVGEKVDAEILGVELLPERVSLSLKALHEDPMRLLTGRIGRTVVGPVTKVLPFGVTVRVEEVTDGFEGLVHISELRDEQLDGTDIAVRVGDLLAVRILDVDPIRRRIVLSHRRAVAAA
ncbi:S1 RNA-binding domain-containing protein [Streptomyces sp. bgisy029]|uniref:S1 RNA-binding domain-containing protein n=1 Tax=Streptomyces sp. bgisy029 TaxID=3413771 RepID=UPI003D75C497